MAHLFFEAASPIIKMYYSVSSVVNNLKRRLAQIFAD